MYDDILYYSFLITHHHGDGISGTMKPSASLPCCMQVNSPAVTSAAFMGTRQVWAWGPAPSMPCSGRRQSSEILSLTCGGGSSVTQASVMLRSMCVSVALLEKTRILHPELIRFVERDWWQQDDMSGWVVVWQDEYVNYYHYYWSSVYVVSEAAPYVCTTLRRMDPVEWKYVDEVQHD